MFRIKTDESFPIVCCTLILKGGSLFLTICLFNKRWYERYDTYFFSVCHSLLHFPLEIITTSTFGTFKHACQYRQHNCTYLCRYLLVKMKQQILKYMFSSLKGTKSKPVYLSWYNTTAEKHWAIHFCSLLDIYIYIYAIMGVKELYVPNSPWTQGPITDGTGSTGSWLP